jgi:hypothetical protein
MMSPIAIKTARETEGCPVKGTGRRNTHYEHASIADQMRTAPNIEELGYLRAVVRVGCDRGTIDASPKTLAEWEHILWTRVLTFILQADEDPSPSFIYNIVLGWDKPRAVAVAIEAALEARNRELPSPADRLRQRGIIIT